MPKYSVDMMRTLSAITEKKEIEYQGNVLLSQQHNSSCK
jgi:hypothetical protein